jgi:RNA polymerase sigma-70 factor, ECF subfamily
MARGLIGAPPPQVSLKIGLRNKVSSSSIQNKCRLGLEVLTQSRQSIRCAFRRYTLPLIMDSGQFTTLLEKWSCGDQSALKALTPVVYGELRKLAAANLARERADHTLTPTALIHEAYIKLVDHKQERWHGRAHFFAVASHIMREILIDHARKHRAAKRGGGQAKVSLEDAMAFVPEKSDAILILDEALQELAEYDERKARIIELRYFGGLSGQEIVKVLNVSIATVTRDSRMAEAWLQRYLKRKTTSG